MCRFLGRCRWVEHLFVFFGIIASRQKSIIYVCLQIIFFILSLLFSILLLKFDHFDLVYVETCGRQTLRHNLFILIIGRLLHNYDNRLLLRLLLQLLWRLLFFLILVLKLLIRGRLLLLRKNWVSGRHPRGHRRHALGRHQKGGTSSSSSSLWNHFHHDWLSSGRVRGCAYRLADGCIDDHGWFFGQIILLIIVIYHFFNIFFN